MTMLEAAKSVFTKYAQFSGRARRREFWLFYIFDWLVSAALLAFAIILSLAGDVGVIGFVLFGVYRLGSLIPWLAVAARRFQDAGKPASYLFFSLVPVVGYILMLVWLAEDGEPGPNRYGPDPKEGSPDRAYSKPSSVPGKTCPHCGKSIDASSRFCTYCGGDCRAPAPKPEAKAPCCPGCGRKVDPSASFCSHCGTALKTTPVKPRETNSRRFSPPPAHTTAAPTPSPAPHKSAGGLSAPTDLD